MALITFVAHDQLTGSHCFIELCCTFEVKHQSTLTISSICCFQIHLSFLDHMKKWLVFFPLHHFYLKNVIQKFYLKIWFGYFPKGWHTLRLRESTYNVRQLAIQILQTKTHHSFYSSRLKIVPSCESGFHVLLARRVMHSR